MKNEHQNIPSFYLLLDSIQRIGPEFCFKTLLMYLKKFKTKNSLVENNITNKAIYNDFQFQYSELELVSLSIKRDTSWDKFQKILKLSERNINYWDKEETQRKIIKLSKFIECTFSEIQQNQDQNLKTKLKDFLLGEDQEGLYVSWDRNYALGDFLMDNVFEDLSPLYPEDIFGMLITLDRVLLFLKETLRQKKYKLIGHQIDVLNDALSSHLTLLSSCREL